MLIYMKNTRSRFSDANFCIGVRIQMDVDLFYIIQDKIGLENILNFVLVDDSLIV